MFGLKKSQIIITTHSPSFLNKLTDHLADVRLVKKAPNGGTVIHTLMDVVRDKLGTIDSDQSLGEVWEMGLLEEAVHESIS
jgi:predicted ATPase